MEGASPSSSRIQSNLHAYMVWRGLATINTKNQRGKAEVQFSDQVNYGATIHWMPLSIHCLGSCPVLRHDNRMYFVEGNSKSSRLTANHSAMEYNPQFLLGGITLVEKKYDLDGGIGIQRCLRAESRSRRGDVNRSQKQIPLTLRSGIDRNNGRKSNVKALVHS